MSEADDPGASEKEPLKPSKILVVDDEPDLEHLVRQRMRREIRSGNYIFVFAHNGVEALKMLSEDEYWGSHSVFALTASAHPSAAY